MGFRHNQNSLRKKKLNLGNPLESIGFMSQLAQIFAFGQIRTTTYDETLHNTTIKVMDAYIDSMDARHWDALDAFVRDQNKITVQRCLLSYAALSRREEPFLESFLTTGKTLLKECGASNFLVSSFVNYEQSKPYPEKSPRKKALLEIAAHL